MGLEFCFIQLGGQSNMILGIISAILYLLVSGLFITKRLTKGKVRRTFYIIHKPLGFVLLGVSMLHFILSLQLIKQRPIAMLILGFIMMITQILGILVMMLRKKITKAILLHKITALVMLVCLILHVYFGITSFQEYQTKIKAIAITGVDLSKVKDGTYVGEYDVEYIYAKVAVTVESGIIKEIKILDHRNERGKRGEDVIQRILENQSVEVDTVSGATNSSNVIRKAVENALKQG
jgi:uncharacterized protein with FMN-binding domain